MATISSIQGATTAPQKNVVEPRASAGSQSASPSASVQAGETTTTAPGPAQLENPIQFSQSELEAAVQELGEAMADLPGGAREVNLLYEPEDHSYLIEIRNKETGVILQTFPPENLLNLRRRSADLLGVLIDCHS